MRVWAQLLTLSERGAARTQIRGPWPEQVTRTSDPVTADMYPPDYERDLMVRASREQLFTAIATADGLRGWWTADVQGTAEVGDVVRLGVALPTHDEWIVMRVDTARRPEAVAWTCVAEFVAPQRLTCRRDIREL
jgi:hypothetical protein